MTGLGAGATHFNLPHMRQCLFCLNPANSKEHVWANWLRAYVPRTQINHIETLVELDVTGEEQVTPIRKSGDPRSRKLKIVCTTCNNGWMSQVQDKAKPYLVRLIAGEKCELPRQARSALARWAALFVTVQEQIHPDLASISAEDREWIRTRPTAPHNWSVWMGRFIDPDGHSRSSRNAIPVVAKEELYRQRGLFGQVAYNAQTSTFLVGPVLFHAISGPTRLRFTFPQTVDEKLHRLWPTNGRGISWPTSLLSEADYSTITDEMRRRIDERHPWLVGRRPS